MAVTLWHLAVLALAQAGVTVAGALGAGACHKWYITFGLRPPPATAFASEYGFLALALPLAWVVVALESVRRGGEYRGVAGWVFPSGIALLLLLLLGAWHAGASPILRLFFSWDSTL
jgi:hypothetical protein